jgi:transposase
LYVRDAGSAASTAVVASTSLLAALQRRLHTRKQQVAALDTATGETLERQLVHEGRAVEEFYAALPRPVTVGIESTGYTIWFHALMHHLGHTVLVGDAAKIRAMVVRKTKTDQRDARHLLDLLRHDRFPTVWVPDPATRDLRALLTHRRRLVRIQTMLKNGLHAIALNQRLARGAKLLRHAGLAQLQALPLPPYTAQRRDHSLELLGTLHTKIQQLDAPLGARPSRPARRASRRRSQTHLLHATPSPRPREGQVAVTRKLLVRLFIMLRDQIDYAEFRRRGRPPAPVPAG